MKKLLFVALFLATGLVVKTYAQPVQPLKWYSWEEGYAKAKSEDKILLIDIYTDWCGWCKKMDRDTYTNLTIIGMINSDFIPVKFNPEIKNVTYKVDNNSYTGQQLLSQLTQNQLTGYPTTVFLRPAKNMLMDIVPGYKDATALEALLIKYKTMKTTQN